MNPRGIFIATLPFVGLKLSLKFIFVVLKVTIFATAVWGLITQGEWYAVEGGKVFAFESLSFLIFPAIIFFVVMPILSFALRVYGRYMVRVGHIAVIVHAIRTGKVPPNQIAFGFKMVRKNFIRANVFFMLDRLVNHAVVELQTAMRGILMGFGILATIATIFKGNLVKHIDECCLGYTFMQKDAEPFKGAVYGIAIYVNGWKSMAKRAIIVTLESVGITILFYVIGVLLLAMSEYSQSPIGIVFSFAFIFIVGAIKTCVLDSYVMVNMLVSFLREARKQKYKPEEFVSQIEKISAMSSAFGTFVFQANQNEPFLSMEEEARILASGRRIPRSF